MSKQDKPQGAPEPTEIIKVETVPAREALRLARTGHFTNSASALALFLSENALREHGYV